jgi:hypothetical protein
MVKITTILILFCIILPNIFAQETENLTSNTENLANESITDSPEELEEKIAILNKAKLIGCVRLARSRLFHDKEKMNKLFEAAGTDKVVSTLLINCYSKISMEQATDFVSIEKNEDIQALLPENVALLELEKWIEIYGKKDKNVIYEEMDKMKEATESFLKTQEILKKESDEEDRRNGVNKENTQTQDESIPKDKTRKPSFSLLGYDIFGMNPLIKNAIGFGFLIVIFGLLYVGLQKLIPKEQTKKKKNKKN